jgi:RNA polymerase sigma-70 factor, ECF subfamily
VTHSGLEGALLTQARKGDEAAFRELVEAHHAELRGYCYRMLGSVHDADDAVQDALLRAWRGLPGFEGRSSMRSWLHSIATNTALDIIRRRSRRELPAGFGPAAGPGGELGAAVADPLWLEPCPDQWLSGPVAASPEARYEQRESVELAFLAALQQLPGRQRAVLILREVMGFSATEVAAQLGTTVAAVNSAMQRARATLRSGLTGPSQQVTLRELGDARIRDIIQRYTDAMENGDADTLVSMLTEDATWSMPPVPTYYRGHERIREFLVRYPLREDWRHHPGRASGQLAVGCYLRAADGTRYEPAVLDVLTMAGPKISAVTAFVLLGEQDARPKTDPVEFFTSFGLPASLPA